MPSSTNRPYSLRSGLRPLVILGAPRSGTKLLRSLLDRSRTCTTIPYGISHVWRLGCSPDAPDRRPPSDGTAQRARQIRSHLLDLAEARHTPSSGYLVEKTCANTLRVPFVNRVLPDARFIHILRDGRDAAVSAREKWKRPPAFGDALRKLTYVSLRRPSFFPQYLRNLWAGLRSNGHAQYWGPRYEGMRNDIREQSLLTVCARQWKACVTTVLNDLSQRSGDRVITIRYESLVTDRTVLENVIETLNLDGAADILDYYQSLVHDHSIGRWRRDLSSADQKKLTAALQPTLDRIGDLFSPSTP